MLSPDKEEYIKVALENLEKTSRTARGILDTSSSVTKAGQIENGLFPDVVAEMARENYTGVITRLYGQRHLQFENTEKLRAFVEGIAIEVNKGITKSGVLIRSGADSVKYPYTKLADLEGAMDQFYPEFLKELDETDPKELAAWIEYRINLTDHFFADGCGKTSKAVSAWVLMRNGLPLPRFRSYEELYDYGPTRIRGLDPERDLKEYTSWVAYYKSLFAE